MKHIAPISSPRSASIVEFDALVAVFGRSLAAATSMVNFVLVLIGLPGQVDKIKGTNS